MEKVRILVITTWNYHDALIQSHTLPYLKIIHDINPGTEVYLVTQEKDKEMLKPTQRQQAGAALSPFNIHFVPQQYHRFGLVKLITSVIQFLQLWWLIIAKKITHIHCFCTPAGSVGYMLSVMTGRKLVLDSYEPHAESMVENGTWKKDGLAFNILWWFEKAQTKKAVHHIAIASGMDTYARKKYGVSIDSIVVKPCCVDLDKFAFHADNYTELRSKLGWTDKIVCVYAGKFGGIYLEKEVFDFFKIASEFWGDRFRVLLLSTLTKQEVAAYCKASKISEKIFFVDKVPFPSMPRFLSAGDFGFTPVKPVPSKRYCSPIKDGEYWAVGMPVVITANISDDSDIIEQHGIGAVLHSLDAVEYLKAVMKIDELLKRDRDGLRKQIRKVAQEYRNFNIAYRAYNGIYPSNQKLHNATSISLQD